MIEHVVYKIILNAKAIELIFDFIEFIETIFVFMPV